MNRKNIVKEKSFAFAIRIVRLKQFLVENKNEYVLSNQVLRSGTSIGALIREAEQAQSKADFIHKLSISLKEANETLYWLELLVDTDYISKMEFESIHGDAMEIFRLLTSIIKKTKINLVEKG